MIPEDCGRGDQDEDKSVLFLRICPKSCPCGIVGNASRVPWRRLWPALFVWAEPLESQEGERKDAFGGI